jgi:uncharacterized protein YbaR (Trm112 family)
VALELLSLLGCPREPERPPLRREVWPGDSQQGRAEQEWFICTVCGYGYRLEQGIPNMLPEMAVAPDELARLKAAAEIGTNDRE